MPTGLREGLGGEEVLASGAGALTQNPFFLGDVTATGSFIGSAASFQSAAITGALSAANSSNTGSSVAGGQGFVANVGSPYSCGLVVPFTARTNISGGMFVSMSGGLAYAAPASTLWPVGIAVATAASGASVNVLLNGVAPVIAEGTVAVGATAQMGAGGGLNCIKPADATKVVSGCRLFGVLDAAGSGTTSTVFVQF